MAGRCGKAALLYSGQSKAAVMLFRDARSRGRLASSKDIGILEDLVMMRWGKGLPMALVLLGSSILSAQTSIDLRTQSKSVDFSGAISTIPFKTGLALPATCSQGEAFMDLDETPGENLYLCVAADTWSKAGSGGSGTGDVSGPGGATQYGVAIFGDATGGVLAEATGCVYSADGGRGILSCNGGFEGGDGTEQGGLITRETVANGGVFEWAIFGPADQASDRCIVFPDEQPVSGEALFATAQTADVQVLGKTFHGCQVMSWGSGVSFARGWHAPFGTAHGAVQQLGAANAVEYGGFTLPHKMLADRITLRVSQGTGGVVAGIYDSACNRLAQATPVNITASGPVSLTFAAPVELNAGELYYFAWSSESTGLGVETATSPGDTLELIRAAGFAFRGANSSTGSGTSLSLPSACGSPNSSGGTAPMILLVAE